MNEELKQKLNAAGAVRGQRGERVVAESFGDPAAEVRTARESAAFFDLSHRSLLLAEGEDAERFLNGMLSQPVQSLAKGNGIYSLLCNEKGRVLADLYLWRESAGSFTIDTAAELGQRVFDTLDHYIIGDDVELEDQSGSKALFHLAGPDARRILQDLGVCPIDTPLARTHGELNGRTKATVCRNDRSGTEGFDLRCDPEEAARVWEWLSAKGARPAGQRAFEILMLENGMPRYGVDFSEANLPQEAGLKHAFSTTKGCYIGQEVICKIESYANVNKTLLGFTLSEDKVPPAGASLYANGAEVGQLTQAAPSPTLGKVLALGYVKRRALDQGVDLANLEARWEGGSARASRADLPFVAPGS